MKKIFYLALTVLLTIGVSSCKCTNDEPTPEAAVIDVENTVSLDKETVFADYGENYRYYETEVVLANYLDEENDGTVAEVTNVFQVMPTEETDVHVIMFTHDTTGTTVNDVASFWVGDCPLNDEAVCLNFVTAFERLNEANLPKPHSKHAVLRKELGPLDCNPQWVFGNQHVQVYVDATTGEVRDYNPAFPKDAQLNYAFSW